MLSICASFCYWYPRGTKTTSPRSANEILAFVHRCILKQSAILNQNGNPVLNELIQIMIRRYEILVDRGFLAPHFLAKMAGCPSEVIKFIRQNRSAVGDTLMKRLHPRQRPTLRQLEEEGISLRGYYDHTINTASTATMELEMEMERNTDSQIDSLIANVSDDMKPFVMRTYLLISGYSRATNTPLISEDVL